MRPRLRHCLLLGAGLFLTATAAPAWSFALDAAFESQRARPSQVPARGFSAGISQDLGDYFWIGAGYSRLTTEPFSTDGGVTYGSEEYSAGSASLGVGRFFTDTFGMSLGAGYTRSEARGRDDFSGNPAYRTGGPTGSLALIFRLSQWTEIFMGPAYSYVGREAAWQGNIGLSQQLLPGVWLNGGFWGAASSTGWNVGLRFGN